MWPCDDLVIGLLSCDKVSCYFAFGERAEFVCLQITEIRKFVFLEVSHFVLLQFYSCVSKTQRQNVIFCRAVQQRIFFMNVKEFAMDNFLVLSALKTAKRNKGLRAEKTVFRRPLFLHFLTDCEK